MALDRIVFYIIMETKDDAGLLVGLRRSTSQTLAAFTEANLEERMSAQFLEVP